jgi:RimJ/RimL family protein N-acetyltransferase
MINPFWVISTGRLMLTPVSAGDLPDLEALKSDPQVFAVMLGGVRTKAQVSEELARDLITWSAKGYGIWTIREAETGRFVGVTGLEDRPDGRGAALRFALWPEAQGRGYAREAAGAALRFGHARAGLKRIVAVARESNFASRTVLGGIGMSQCDSFIQNGHRMLLYESIDPHAGLDRER